MVAIERRVDPVRRNGRDDAAADLATGVAATVPAMADLKHLGAASLQAAHAGAEEHARRVAELVAASDSAVDLTALRAAA